jgi:peptidoglycan hydrolase-like amidase
MKQTLRTRAIALLIGIALLMGSFYFPAAADTVLLGDLDADSSITVSDARTALRMAIGLERRSDGYILIADVNTDGRVTTGDARAILRVAIGLENFGGRTVEAELTPYSQYGQLPTYIPPAPVISAPSGTFTFVYYGWGHCVGLSQYGAIIMAQAGYPYESILGYYFSGGVLVKGGGYPETSYYAGEYLNTYELLCRIVAQEIGGAGDAPEALKSQAVAVFTLMKYYNFSISTKYTVGYAMELSRYNNLPSSLKTTIREAVKAVIGEYIAVASDPNLKPALTVYGSMVAGRTLSAKEVWGYSEFPVSVSSPFEASLPNFATVKNYTKDEIYAKIRANLPGATLSADPAQWIRITKHDGSLDANRGYVFEVMVGDQVLSGLDALTNKLGLRLGSPCYTVTYTP